MFLTVKSVIIYSPQCQWKVGWNFAVYKMFLDLGNKTALLNNLSRWRLVSNSVDKEYKMAPYALFRVMPISRSQRIPNRFKKTSFIPLKLVQTLQMGVLHIKFQL